MIVTKSLTYVPMLIWNAPILRPSGTLDFSIADSEEEDQCQYQPRYNEKNEITNEHRNNALFLSWNCEKKGQFKDRGKSVEQEAEKRAISPCIRYRVCLVDWGGSIEVSGNGRARIEDKERIRRGSSPNTGAWAHGGLCSILMLSSG